MTALLPQAGELQRLHDALDAPVDRVELIELPMADYLMIDGAGHPDETPFTDAVHALYGLSYAVRFLLRGAGQRLEPLMPLEALWASPDGDAWSPLEPELWTWTLMLAQPPSVTQATVDAAKARARSHEHGRLVDRVRLAAFSEGLAAQILHVGPYDAELPTISRLHTAISELGCVAFGRHHEIYLGDPRRSAPERLRTILRQPVQRDI